MAIIKRKTAKKASKTTKRKVSRKATKKAGKAVTKRRVAKKGSKAGSKRKLPTALRNWIKAARSLGFFKSGAGFKPLPRKGTAAYKQIKAKAMKILQ